MSPALFFGLTAEDGKNGIRINISLKTEAQPVLEEAVNNMDQEICGDKLPRRTFRKSAKNELADAVIWIDDDKLHTPEWARESVSVKIMNCQFKPRVVFVDPKQNVQVSTDDAVGFDLQFESQSQGIRARYLPPNLRSTNITFDHPDFVKIRCLLHPGTVGYLVVKGHPFYGTTNDSGKTEWNGVPPGNYRLAVWHEVLGLRKTAQPVSLRDSNEKIELKWEDLIP